MPEEAALEQFTDHLLLLCATVSQELRDVRDDTRRYHCIVGFQGDDPRARRVLVAVERWMDRDESALTDPSPAPSAHICRHDRLIHHLREAGYEVPDYDDPGPGCIFAIFVLASNRCVRTALIVDHALHEADETLMKKAAELPGVVKNAASTVIGEAMTYPERDRRCLLALFVCHCDDPKAAAFLIAMARENVGEAPTIQPGYALGGIAMHETVARLARAVGYTVPDLPEPNLGRMRAYMFARGELLAHDIQIVSEKEAKESEAAAEAATRSACHRLLDEKEGLLMAAAQTILSKPTGYLDEIIVLFATHTSISRAVYEALTALPAGKRFPKDMPDGIFVVTVPYGAFMEIARRQEPEAPGIEASQIKANHVRVALFAPDGFFITLMHSVPFARGGSA